MPEVRRRVRADCARGRGAEHRRDVCHRERVAPLRPGAGAAGKSGPAIDRWRLRPDARSDPQLRADPPDRRADEEPPQRRPAGALQGRRLTWTVAAILKNRMGRDPISDDELARAKKDYDTLSEASARRT